MTMFLIISGVIIVISTLVMMYIYCAGAGTSLSVTNNYLHSKNKHK